MKEKTFYKILIEFTFSIEKTKRRIADLRLTKTEKLIIEGHLNIRKNLNQEVLTTLSELPPSDLAFVESQRQYLIGASLNNLSRFKEAEKHIHQSLEILQRVEAPFFSFYAYLMLFTIYDNLHQPSMMLKTIKAMEKLEKNKRQEVQFLICEFCYEQQMGHNEKAQKYLSQIDQRMNDLTEGDIVRQLVNKFVFCVQLEELDRAKNVLVELKQYRNYQLSENYNFMKKLLDHLTEGSPLYVYDDQFENIPVLLHQLKVIQSFEEKNMDQAKVHWEKLKAISPSTYGEGFDYKGSKCLFSLALHKHHAEHDSTNLAFTPVGETKLDQLYSILTNTKAPIHGSLIHELIWGSSPVDKEDFKKVSRLISRLKAEKNMVVEFRKGVYSVVKEKKVKVS